METNRSTSATIFTTLVKLDLPLKLEEVPFLRGLFLHTSAQAAKDSGKEACDVTLHNHEEGGGLRYGYPLVQYKCLDGNAAAIVLSHSVDDMSDLSIPPDGKVRLGRRFAQMQLGGIFRSETTLGITPESHRYKVSNYLPFNQENYATFAHEPGLVRRMQMVEHCLTGNILSLCKGLNVWLDKDVEVHLEDFHQISPVHFKGVKMSRFDVTMSANVSLPPLAGLGRGVSHGFGTVLPVE